MKYLLAHDLGTSGNKATLFSEEGQLIKSCVSSYGTRYFNGNWAEQNPDDWWQAVKLSTKELMQDTDAADIAAISFSGQMMGCLCVDGDGKPLREHILWADMRSTEQEAFLRKQVDPRRFYEITGHRPSSSYSLTKLMWVRDNEPDVYAKTYKVLNAKDYIIFRLTGKYYTDHSDATGTNAFDINKSVWSAEIMDAVGIDMEKFPQAVTSVTVAGELTAAAAAECALKEGTPVVLGAGDGVAAAVGAGAVREGVTFNCLGSSSWIGASAKKPVLDDEMSVFNWAHAVPGLVSPCGTMQSAGSSYNWMKQQLCGGETLLAKEGGNAYDLINGGIEKSAPGAQNLFFLPYLIGERSPRWNPLARGAFVGLTMEHTHEDMLRSVVEGVGLNLRVIMDTLNSQVGITDMIAIGGLAQSDVILQILADIFGVDVLPLNHIEEASSIGAAVIAGVGAGVLSGFDEVGRFVHTVGRFVPNAKNHAKYNTMLPVFNQIYHSLTGVYESLAGL